MDTHRARTEAIQKEIVAPDGRPSGKDGSQCECLTTACQQVTAACLEKARAGLEEITERKHISYEHEC
jgi:hypothetical protein